MLDSWFDFVATGGAFVVLAAFVWLRPHALDPLDTPPTQPQAPGEGIAVSELEGVSNSLTPPLVEKTDNHSGSHTPPSILLGSRPTLPPRTRREGIRPLPPPPGGPSVQELSLDSLSDSEVFDIVLLGRSSTRISHRVRLRTTGALYVRKSMMPRGLPIHDIVKELKRMKEVRHPNIVKCLSVFPTSIVAYEEVTVVMEFCEGGNLELARKAIKDRGVVVEEKVAGRIAEGVSLELCNPLLF